MITHSKRLNTVEEYYFSKKLREVSKMISSGKPVINMGIGSPDLYPSKNVIDEIKSSLSDQNRHTNTKAIKVLPELRRGYKSKFYQKVILQVNLNLFK